MTSIDEKTGIQALERLHPTRPMAAGQPEAVEFEYVRHGTQALIANFDVATGQVIAPTVGDTRTEADFVAHLGQTVATDPQGEWIFIADQLNTHKSAGLVQTVAELLWDTGGPGSEGTSRRSARYGDPGGVLAGLRTPHSVDLHAQALLVAQPGGDVVRHFDPAPPEAGSICLNRRTQTSDSGVHQLL